ncbi:polysaccharide deacetylase family protein [Kitasatospora sp. NPDC048540]|uniref:polysaccharide deacetylase family protein n=1 Tax=unclassified Kitasatospora TaxID=2633591 RepID=UPI0009E8A20A|nr:polysaccharide deacetylase family protein [Kitasatospora sp. MBT63]
MSHEPTQSPFGLRTPPAGLLSGSGVSRRSALRLAGAGGLLAAGGTLLTGCGDDPAAGSPATAASTAAASASATGKPKEAGSDLPILTPAGYNPSSRRATWSQQFQTGHGWSAGGAGTAGYELNDASLFLQGTQSVRVTTDGSGRQSYVRRTGMPKLDLTNKMIRLTLRVDDTTHLHKLGFYLGTGSLANNFQWQFHTHSTKAANYVQSGEWVVVHLQWADVTNTAGSFSLSPVGVPSATSGFTDMSFVAYDDANSRVTYHLQSVEILPDTRTIFPRGAVSITFDDSYSSVFDLARPVMNSHGFPGTMYNIAQAAGTANYLTIDQMRTMQESSGWEMAGHAYSTAAHNSGYNQLTSQQVDEDMGKLRDWLTSNRFSTENFAYPHGAFQETSDGVGVDRIASRHFSTARSIIYETIESFAPAMPYRLKALTGLNDGDNVGGSTLAEVIGPGGKLDRCAKSGDWLILCFHDIVAGSPVASTQISQAGVTKVMEAIAARGMPVVTISEAMKHYS